MTDLDLGDKDPSDWTEEDRLRQHHKVQRMIAEELKYPLEFQYAGFNFTCLAGAFPGFEGETYIRDLPLQEKPGGNRVLEIGSGTGCVSAALYLDRKDAISTILATDITTAALNSTELNFRRYSIPGRCIISDLFNDIDKGEKFDLIFWNFPYSCVPLQGPLSDMDKAMVDPHYANVGRYVKQAGEFLTSGGKVALVFSPTIGNLNVLLDVVKKQEKSLKLLREYQVSTRFVNTKIVQLYEVTDVKLCTL